MQTASYLRLHDDDPFGRAILEQLTRLGCYCSSVVPQPLFDKHLVDSHVATVAVWTLFIQHSNNRSSIADVIISYIICYTNIHQCM